MAKIPTLLNEPMAGKIVHWVNKWKSIYLDLFKSGSMLYVQETNSTLCLIQFNSSLMFIRIVFWFELNFPPWLKFQLLTYFVKLFSDLVAVLNCNTSAVSWSFWPHHLKKAFKGKKFRLFCKNHKSQSFQELLGKF